MVLYSHIGEEQHVHTFILTVKSVRSCHHPRQGQEVVTTVDQQDIYMYLLVLVCLDNSV